MTDIEELYVSLVHVKPVNVDSWSDKAGEDGEGFSWWDTITYEHDDDREFTLLTSRGSVTAVVIDGKAYSDYADFLADWLLDEGTNEDALPITEEDFDHLMEVEAVMWGDEGPMMNYWYPLDESTYSSWSKFDPKDAALKLADLPLCVVEVDGQYGLALTGGGMDLSWDICKAFVALGYLPPAHFADLPNFAGGHGHDSEALAAMRRSLTVVVQQAQRDLDRLNTTFGGE